jgi:hypothetical protein
LREIVFVIEFKVASDQFEAADRGPRKAANKLAPKEPLQQEESQERR